MISKQRVTSEIDSERSPNHYLLSWLDKNISHATMTLIGRSIAKVSTSIEELGRANALCYYLDRLLLAMPGRNGAVRYLFVAQPVPNGPLLPPRRGARIKVEQIDVMDPRLHVDQRLTLADSDLRKVCRMCDLADVEVRFPFLDENLMEYSARIPPKLMLKDGRLRTFYKEALESVLPRETLEKSKHGFGLPYIRFLKESPILRELARTSLEELRDYGLFRADFLDQLSQRLDSLSKGQEDSAIWDFVVIRQWLASRGGLSFA